MRSSDWSSDVCSSDLRQPIHAEDVAAACVVALQAPGAANRAYNLSGGETLAYREMVARVFAALGRPARLVTVPLWAFRLAVAVLRRLPRYRHWTEIGSASCREGESQYV